MLIKYTAWFVAKMWPDGVQRYRDALRCVLQQFNFVDQCMMYQACTGKKWVRDKILWIEMRRLGLNYDWVEVPKVIKHAPYDLACPILLKLFDQQYFPYWLEKVIKYNHMHVLAVALQEYQTGFDYMWGRLMVKASYFDNLQACEMIHSHVPEYDRSNIKMHIRKQTYAWLHAHGYRFSTTVLDLLHNALINDDWTELPSICKGAIGSGIGLDEVHARMSIGDMLGNYDDLSLRAVDWFISKGVGMDRLKLGMMLNADAWIMCKRGDPVTCAHMLAKTYAALKWHKKHPFAYCRETFNRIASWRVREKVLKYECFGK